MTTYGSTDLDHVPGLSPLLPQYAARLASDEATRRDAYSLRYLCYLDRGFIAPNKHKLFSDKFDQLPNTETVVVYQDKEPIASVWVCFLSLFHPTPAPVRDRLAGLLGIHRDVRMILSCVQHNHVHFYHRMQYRVVAGPKNYPRLTRLMYLLSCTREDYDAVRGRFPLMDPDAFPQDDVSGLLAGQPMTTQIRPS